LTLKILSAPRRAKIRDVKSATRPRPTNFPACRLGESIRYPGATKGEGFVSTVLQDSIPNRKDAWKRALDRTSRYRNHTAGLECSPRFDAAGGQLAASVACPGSSSSPLIITAHSQSARLFGAQLQHDPLVIELIHLVAPFVVDGA
jgi:hypothetical protein